MFASGTMPKKISSRTLAPRSLHRRLPLALSSPPPPVAARVARATRIIILVGAVLGIVGGINNSSELASDTPSQSALDTAQHERYAGSARECGRGRLAWSRRRQGEVLRRQRSVTDPHVCVVHRVTAIGLAAI